jgi:hypothetical protein
LTTIVKNPRRVKGLAQGTEHGRGDDGDASLVVMNYCQAPINTATPFGAMVA